jgi:deoxyxylulose-5-phosphate synthase
MSKIYFQVFITLDLRQLDEVQLPQLAKFTWFYYWYSISKRRPIVASLGVIELTIALHYVLIHLMICLFGM